ncbi:MULTISPECIES: HutD family protein [unclassified Mycolicibacterium]|nr:MULTISPECIES: HutD family protein [unclassified Mycolicibacterium]
MSISAGTEVVRFSECVDQPWANGGGSTRVIAVGPDNSKAGAFDWRLSIASVTSGAFSRFPGVDRTIVLADGPSMTLTIDGEQHVLDPFRPRRFAGESAVTCEASQPSFDFNVMTRRGVCSADVSIRVGSGHLGAPLDCLTFIVALAGAVTVRSAGGRAVKMGRFDSVALSAGAELCVGPKGRAAVVRVKYAAGQLAR